MLDNDTAAHRAIDVARLDAERREVELRTQIELRRIEAAAKRQDRADRRSARQLARVARLAERRQRRSDFAARWRPRVPLIVVNGTAMYGQIAAGYRYLTPDGTEPVTRFAVAVLVASAAELIALYVQWHAHDALLRGDSRTAGRLRKVSYLLAGVIGLVNASHFLDNPAAAIVFGLMSASSPWLWGLHTRRAEHVQLVAQGRADTGGAVFSGERRRHFPIRSLRARRWSIDHGVTDPLVAWEGYRAERNEPPCDCKTAALPGVPTGAELAAMSTEARQDAARRTYLLAVAAGVEVDYKLLATAYRMGERWARARIAEARHDRTES